MSEETKKIPEFLENESAEPYNFDEQKAPAPLKKTLFSLSFLWLIIVFLYLQFSFGWSGLEALMPSDFILFLAGFFIFPLIIFFLIVWVKKVYSNLKQNELIEQSLGRFLKTKDENLLSKIINKALQSQIEELNATVQFLSAQTDTLKKEMNTKAEDFKEISQTLENVFKQNLINLDENKNEYLELCRQLSVKAEETADNLKTHSDALKENADAVHDKLNPLIDETMVTAEHLKAMVDDAQITMAQTKSDLEAFADIGKSSMKNFADMLNAETAKFEKAMLETADGCEEIYKKIDSGISFIENSLQTHKELAAEQSALIDKNASFLDSKLGEYGKLISMEVSAMIERASTLDINVKEQIESLNEASQKINDVLDGANNSLSLKSGKTIQNIENIVQSLNKEILKLSDFAGETEKRNYEVQNMAEKISERIETLSTDLGVKADDLKLRAVEAIDKFNEVSGVLQTNTIQMSENANMILSKSKESSDVIHHQEENLSKAADHFEQIKNEALSIAQNLSDTKKKATDAFEDIKKQMNTYQNLMKERFDELEDQKLKSERHLVEVKSQYQELQLTGFMDKVSLMLEKLENLSIDIHHFFDEGTEDELWKKFYNGDHGAFARQIVKNLNRKKVLKIRDEYEKNADFHEIANRYLREFETLLNAAEKSEKPETILALVSGSDVGKIYYVMARALDKIG